MLQADSGGSASTTNQAMNSTQPGVEQFVMKIPNNKVIAFVVFLSTLEGKSNIISFNAPLTCRRGICRRPNKWKSMLWGENNIVGV